MGHRANFIISDTNWDRLSAVPKGKRSRLVNDALTEYQRVQQRKRAAGAMDELSGALPRVAGSAEDWVRADRNRHG